MVGIGSGPNMGLVSFQGFGCFSFLRDSRGGKLWQNCADAFAKWPAPHLMFFPAFLGAFEDSVFLQEAGGGIVNSGFCVYNFAKNI